ncbi:ty3-gypsy retrotransposon protein [Cucumis melo var. makuwa]|uniref:Ty3-gypsy retrotransposon protein n=1 Tax=Cucumis melo var. makuwa TaxID=1194695 RepID=A0A5A7TC78_CUCMM|nr:ty3-gypsy retrotransposon protein [Cucumis melo var. makuwa]
MESPKAGIVIKENPLYDNSDSASSKLKKEAHPVVMSIMMAYITTEVAMMQTHETTQSSQTPVAKVSDKGKNVVPENQPQQQSASVTSLSVQQL